LHRCYNVPSRVVQSSKFGCYMKKKSSVIYFSFITVFAFSPWTAFSIRTSFDLHSVYFPDTLAGYEVGSVGSILTMTIYDGVLPNSSFQSNSLKIYPNPSSDNLVIETSAMPKNSQLSILNLSGQHPITCQITETKTQIDITNLPSSVYFMRLTNVKTLEVSKLIKK